MIYVSSRATLDSTQDSGSVDLYFTKDESQSESSSTSGDAAIRDAKEEFRSVASSIFSFWDVDYDGHVTLEDIRRVSQLDSTFCNAFFRVLDVNCDGIIDFPDLYQCLGILNENNLRNRVHLFFRFFDTEGFGSLTFSQIQASLKLRGDSIFKLLGFSNEFESSSSKKITPDDLYTVFENSQCGIQAMDTFCGALLNILKAPTLSNNGPESSGDTVHSPSPLFKPKVTVRYVLPWLKTYGFLCGFQVFLWIYNFYIYKNGNYPLSTCIAKGFGLNLFVLTLCIFATMAHTLKGQLYGIRQLKYFIPMRSNVEIHSFLGICILLHSIGHSCAQIVNQSTGILQSFTKPSRLTGSGWNTAMSGDAVSGYLLLFIIIIMSFTAVLRKLSSFAYTVFHRCHFLYVLWLALIVLHVPRLWPYFTAIGAVFLLEVAYMHFMCTTTSTLRACRTRGNVTFLSVRKQAGQPAPTPGCYYRIKVPAISSVEWHPFSLAGSTTSDHLTFIVDSVGDWTNALHTLLQGDPQRRDATTVCVQGPFCSISKKALDQHCETQLSGRQQHKPVVLVASGVGITPFLSVMATRVTDQYACEATKRIFTSLFNESFSEQRQRRRTLSFRSPSLKKAVHAMASFSSMSSASTVSLGNLSSSSNDALNKSLCSSSSGEDEERNALLDSSHALHLVWVIRDCAELLFYVEYLHHLVESQEKMLKLAVVVSVYLTGLGSSCDPSFLVSQTLFYLLLGEKAGQYVKVYFCRPNLQEILRSLSPTAVYYCGGLSLREVTATACRKANNIPFYAENFDSGGIVSLWLRKVWERIIYKAVNVVPVVHHPRDVVPQNDFIL